MADCPSRAGSPYIVLRCRLCGRGAHDSVDLDGVVCGACLRRMNADPQAKRRLLFELASFD